MSVNYGQTFHGPFCKTIIVENLFLSNKLLRLYKHKELNLNFMFSIFKNPNEKEMFMNEKLLQQYM